MDDLFSAEIRMISIITAVQSVNNTAVLAGISYTDVTKTTSSGSSLIGEFPEQSLMSLSGSWQPSATPVDIHSL